MGQKHGQRQNFNSFIRLALLGIIGNRHFYAYIHALVFVLYALIYILSLYYLIVLIDHFIDLFSHNNKNTFIIIMFINSIIGIAAYFASLKLYVYLLKLWRWWRWPSEDDLSTQQIIQDIHFSLCGTVRIIKWKERANWPTLIDRLRNRSEIYRSETQLYEMIRTIFIAGQLLADSLDIHGSKEVLKNWDSDTFEERKELALLCSDFYEAISTPKHKRSPSGMDYQFRPLSEDFPLLFEYIKKSHSVE